MATDKNRFVRVTEHIEIPVPADCTSAEEAALVARFKSNHDLGRLEEEYQELLSHIATSDSNNFPTLSRELEELDQPATKEST
jgi:hypothetical protein